MAWTGWEPGRRAAATEVAVVLVVLAVGVGTLAVPPQPVTGWALAVRLALAVAAGLALLVRRRFPLPVLALAVLDGVVRGDLSAAAPVAGYTVARHEQRPRVRRAALVVAGVLGLVPWQFTSVVEIASNTFNLIFLFLVPAAVGAAVRTRVHLVGTLRGRAERAEQAERLAAREAVLRERARITQEMHDVVGHRVSLIVLQAGAIEMAATDPDRVRRLAGQVQDAGRRSLEELRQLIGLLRAQAEDDGGPSATEPLNPLPTLDDVAGLVADARRAGLDVVLERRGAGRSPDLAVQRTAYRVVQEALTNAGKHAPGAAVTVVVDVRTDELAVTVVNRRAELPPAVLPSGGHGLVGLRERVRSVEGSLRAEPRLDGGFAVEAVLPG